MKKIGDYMSVSKNIKGSIEKSSWIRKMFEEGARLKAQFGDENVYDFSLGNPDVEPPSEFFNELKKIAATTIPGIHGYMPNSGYPGVKEKIAHKVQHDHEIHIKGDSIIMTCGAAGGMNIILKTILDPGDEVIVIRPYFVEYGFYISNHQGVITEVDSAPDFSIDTDKLNNAITHKTKAVIINTPNNPTGKIYQQSDIDKLSKLLSEKSTKDRTIFLISDEPYREIIYNNQKVPPVLSRYKNTFIANSFSKSLSLPGERIGYVAINPEMNEHDLIIAGLNLSNRILGFVNAPALMQRIVAELNDVSVNINAYKRRRDLLVSGLRDAGYEFNTPDGAFYLFCKAPGGDDIAFVKHLQSYNILVVPGLGFGGPGYFRIAYCVSEKIINNAIPKFKDAIISFKK